MASGGDPQLPQLLFDAGGRFARPGEVAPVYLIGPFQRLHIVAPSPQSVFPKDAAGCRTSGSGVDSSTIPRASGQGGHVLVGGLAPDKDDADHVHHVRRPDHLDVHQPGEEDGLVLHKGQHVAHHIRAAGVVDGGVQILFSANKVGVQRQHHVPHGHEGSLPVILIFRWGIYLPRHRGDRPAAEPVRPGEAVLPHVLPV